MFGTSAGGWIGTSSYVMNDKASQLALNTPFTAAEFILYQVNFVLLSALIVYTAIGRQLSSSTHLWLGLFVAILLIPIFGHWAWSGHFITNNKGWLETLGFIDMGGATVSHSIAAWFTLVLVWRLGQQKKVPSHDPDQIEHEPMYCSSAILCLWLSALGLTTGTLSIVSNQITGAMLNIGLAASAGGMTAYLHYYYSRHDKGQITRALGGFSIGMVAVTASATTVSFLEALLIGGMAGIIHNVGFSLLRKRILQQVWQVRAAYIATIHGLGGVWGTLCVALFGSAGVFGMPDMGQFVVQLEGIGMGLLYSAALAQGVFFLWIRYKR